jgi:hypothetical protein
MDVLQPSLSTFGRSLAKATRLRKENFDTSTSAWPEAYKTNAELIHKLRNTIHNRPDVLIIGAGKNDDIQQINHQTKGWLRSGVHWSNFNPCLPVDIVVSTHASPLESSLHSSANQPKLLIHGVYSKVPPCFDRSFTIRWSDPYMLKEWKGKPTAERIESLMEAKSIGVAPYIPAVRNTLFLNAMVMLWLGAKRLIFTSVDPHNPEYFFTGHSEIVLNIIRSLSACDPWLAEWDGRNERIPLYKRSTAHRIQTFTQSLLRQKSAVGGKDYLYEFDRGFKLLSQLAKMRGVELGYLGKSSYMETTNITRIG